MNVLKSLFGKKDQSCCEVKIIEKVDKETSCKEDEKREEKN
ncbi:hypothetical protein [Robertmurraya korlensis]|jgi:hypothetical protein|nr:hypothetical protein [Robertmurraya korlensis]